VRDNEHSRNIIFFAKNILFSRRTSFHKHTNIREISSFSQKLFKFHENYFIFAIFVFTHTHKHTRNIIFFAKYIIFSRRTSLQKHTNIREISSFSQKLFKFHENYFIFAIFVFTHAHKHTRNIIFFAKFVFTHTHTHTHIREISTFIVNYRQLLSG